MNTLTKNSFYISIFTQILIVIITFDIIFIKLKNNNKILYDTFIIEFIVQIIEALFYILIISKLNNVNNINLLRYYDWFITTPFMLISSILYMEYENNKEDKTYTSLKILNKNKENIIKILLLNFGMLICGYLSEIYPEFKNILIILGFILFIKYFYIINKYVNDNENNKKLFIFLFFIWSFYGIASFFSYNNKNIFYNFLDIISKNFYGLFIYYKIKNLK